MVPKRHANQDTKPKQYRQKVNAKSTRQKKGSDKNDWKFNLIRHYVSSAHLQMEMVHKAKNIPTEIYFHFIERFRSSRTHNVLPFDLLSELK